MNRLSVSSPALVWAVTLTLHAGLAFAQDGSSSSGAAAGDVNNSGTGTTTSQGSAPAAAAPAAPVRRATPYGYLPAPGTDVNAHLESSARTLTDIHQSDDFDLKANPNRTHTVRGRSGALGITREQRSPNSGIYVVRKGDTLSSISQRLYGQPWNWPKLWSLNPQIQNPHWIYPGDQIRLTAAELTPFKPRQSQTLGAGSLVNLRPQMDPNTVFLRRVGYIDDPRKGVMGEVVGAKEGVQLLTEHEHVYVVLRPGVKVHKGQELSIFRPSRKPPKVKGVRQPPGEIIAIKGTLRVDYFNPKTRVARGEIIESLDVIERGAKVGMPGRKFELVPPLKTTKNITTRVIASLYPHVNLGQYQVVFIDRGAKDGLQAGNRLFVIRRGDTWRRTLETARAGAQSRIKLDVEGESEVESTPLHGDEQKFPEEVIGELRVIATHPFSSLAVVTASEVEIVPGDRAVARSGF